MKDTNRNFRRLRWQAAISAIVWLAAMLFNRSDLTSHDWARYLILFAAYLLFPLALDVLGSSERSNRTNALFRVAGMIQLPAAILLTAAFLRTPGLVAATLALPWLLVTVLAALAGLNRLLEHRFASLPELAVTAGLLYLAIGGGWTVLSAYGARPLEFADVIVLLTAVHFHYAGFLLPLLTGFAGRLRSNLLTAAAQLGTIAATPLVAIGITATQLGWGSLLEQIAASLTAIIGLAVGMIYLSLSTTRAVTNSPRYLFLLAGLALCGSMILAMLYGLRFIVPLDWVTIPIMRATHGTANAIGFGLCGLLGWCLLKTPGTVIKSAD